jgi:hypothetical protein
MSMPNEIVLRPRFKFDINQINETLLKEFEKQKNKQSHFIITRIDDHVFIKFPKDKQHYWSPQLHLEINEKDENSSTVHGLFGPNPTVWTFFMFLHFIVAGLFIAFSIWTFTNITLNDSYAIPLFLALLTILFWFTLYFIGRMGKVKGKPEMILLYNFMQKHLNP